MRIKKRNKETKKQKGKEDRRRGGDANASPSKVDMY
jgi:hypothetical protein